MNYLAHIYLSGKDKQVQIGNFVGDAELSARHSERDSSSPAD